MDWRGDPATPTKFAYARLVAGALGYVALWRFDRLTVVPFGDGLGTPFGPAQGRSHIVPLLRTLEAMPPLGRTVLVPTVDRYVRERRRPGLLFLVSDLLSGEPAELRALLRALRGRGWQATIIHVVDEAEVAPALAGRYLSAHAPAAATHRPAVELLDAESGDRLRLSPSDDVLARYAAAVGGWLDEVETACRDEQAGYVRLLTSWDFGEVVLGLLHRQGGRRLMPGPTPAPQRPPRACQPRPASVGFAVGARGFIRDPGHPLWLGRKSSPPSPGARERGAGG